MQPCPSTYSMRGTREREVLGGGGFIGFRKWRAREGGSRQLNGLCC